MPLWTSDGSHKDQPRPSGCPPISSGQASNIKGIDGNRGAGQGSPNAASEQPKQGDTADQKGAPQPERATQTSENGGAKPQGEAQKPENGGEKPQDKTKKPDGGGEKPQDSRQKSEERTEEPSASSKTADEARDIGPTGPARMDVARMALAAQRFTRALIAQRQFGAGGPAAATGQDLAKGLDGTVWMSPVAGLGRISGTGGGRLRYDSKGVFVGVDRSWDNLVLGGMLGHLTTSGRSAHGDAYHSGFHGAIYGRAELGSFVLRADIGGSFNTYGLSRRSFAAHAWPDAQRFNANGYGVSASAFAGYVMPVSGIRLIPEIGLEFDRITLAGARGAVAAARRDLAGTMAVSTLRGLIGGRMEMPLDLKGTDGLSVKLSAYWARDLIADRAGTGVAGSAVLNRLALEQTIARARKSSPDGAILGAEIEGHLSKDAIIAASYVTELRGAATSHAVLASLRMNW